MPSLGKFCTVWEYQVREEFLPQFKEVYASDGDWVKLFTRAHGFIKTKLIQDVRDNNRFITIDYWESRSDFINMRDQSGPEYQDLDIRTEKYTVSETHLGYFQDVGPE